MTPSNYIIQLRDKGLAISWLKVGILSLAFAGIHSLVIVVLRTPWISKFFLNPEIFKSSLVVHVNLSILFWLLSIVVSIWSYNLKNNFYNRIYYKLAILAVILVAFSPLGEQYPVMNNYIPMLQNISFVMGISIFGVIILFMAFSVIINIKWRDVTDLLNIAIISTALMFCLTWICFFASYIQLQGIIAIIPVDISFYYELLFWSGGHLLQFIYTQIVIIIWIMLFKGKLKNNNFYALLLWFNFISSTLAVFGHFFFDIIDASFKEYYTQHMRYLGGITPFIVLMSIVYKLSIISKTIKGQYISKVILFCSGILFTLGGIISINISGSNVVIPAHYHGSIVGISIAYMGYAYSTFSADKTKDKLFSITIYTLTIGQIIHILGLFFAGGYGVMRKDPGSLMLLKTKVLMGIMGLGGLIAIVGGLMFVYICVRVAFLKKVEIKHEKAV